MRRLAEPAVRLVHERLLRCDERELCGFALAPAGGPNVVQEVWWATNGSGNRDMALIPYRDYLASHGRARRLGLVVVALFHTHRGGNVQASTHDLEDVPLKLASMIFAAVPGRLASLTMWRDEHGHISSALEEYVLGER